MKEKKVDRRVRKTQKLLKQGLCNLMREKPLKNITIKDITDNVDLNRSTFYLHYTDIDNLLEKTENDFLNEFKSFFDKYEEKLYEERFEKDNIGIIMKKITESIFSYLEDNFDIAYILFNHDDSIFIEKFISISLSKTMEARKILNSNASDLYLEYESVYAAHGAVGIIKKWINSDKRATPIEMSNVLYDFMPSFFEAKSV